jgi:hypothetical protein
MGGSRPDTREGRRDWDGCGWTGTAYAPLSRIWNPGLEFIGWRLVVAGFTADAVEPRTTNPTPYSPKPGFRLDDRVAYELNG